MFWTTPEFPGVVTALYEGFLVSHQLFCGTIIGAVPRPAGPVHLGRR